MPARTPHRRVPPPAGWAVPAGVVAGGAIGLVIGVLLGQLAHGLTLGAAVGLFAGASLTAIQAAPAERRSAILAVAIGVLTVGLAFVVLIVVR